MLQRILYLLKVYVVFVLAFVLAKPAFMFYQANAQPFSLSDVWQVIRHGLSLDLSTALYFILLPFLVVMVSVWWPSRKVLGSILKVYYAFAAIVLSLAFVADTSLYEFWGFKLDASVLQFLDGTGHVTDSVSTGYVVVRIACFLVVAAMLYFVLSGYGVRDTRYENGSSEQSNLAPRTSHLVPRILHSFLFLLLIPLLVIGIRGGTSVSTTNVGQVYFSQNQFLNHSAVNPVFSFLASFGKSSNDIPDYHFYPDSDLPQGLFDTPRGPVSRCITATRPNILLIIMESCGGQFTELGGNAHVTPNLTRLANEGIYFTRCYANSWRTDRGMLSIMSGYPALPKTSIMKMPSKVRTLPSIALSLQREGYRTAFLYGGDADFTNTRGYLMSTGVETIVSEDDFTSEQRGSSKWGVCDSIAFDRLYEMAVAPLPSPPSGEATERQANEGSAFGPSPLWGDKRGASGEPSFITFLTLSSHEPWTVPMPTKFQDEKLNAFYYLDLCLGRFIERFRKTEAWENTLVVIIPDHGIKYKDQDETKEIRSHIPMIWTGGVISGAQRIDCLCNQSDLAATLLGQLGLPHDDFTFSRDVLSPDYSRPFAIHTFPEGFSVVDSTGFSVYDLNSQRQTVGRSPQAIQTGKAVLQLIADDLRNR